MQIKGLLKNWFKKIRKNFIVASMLSYLCVIIIMLAVILTIIGIYQGYSVDESVAFNKYVFKNVMTSVNETLNGVNSLYFHLAHDKNLASLSNSQSKNYFSEQKTYDLIDSLKSYGQLATNVDMFFVYLKSTDSVIYEGGILSSRSFYNTWFSSENSTYEDWLNSLTETSEHRYIAMHGVDKNGTPTEFISFLFNIGSSGSVGVILSDKENLIKNTEDISWNAGCNIFVFNPYDKLVVCRTSPDFSLSLPVNAQEIVDYEKRGYAVFSDYIITNNNRWQVLAAVDKTKLGQDLKHIQHWVIVIMISSLLLLVFIVILLIRRNIRPIKKLFELSNVSKNASLDSVYESIKNILSKNDYLMLDIKHKNDMLQKAAMSYLLKGNLTQYALCGYTPYFSGTYFAVAAFDIADISTLFPDEGLSESESSQQLFFIIQNVMSELLKNDGLEVSFNEIDNIFVAIINSEKRFDLKKLFSTILNGTEFINKNFDINLTYVLSDLNEGVYNIQVAYAHATECIEHQRFFGINNPIMYSEIAENDTNSIYAFDFISEQSLTNDIKGGDRESAKMVIDRVFDKLKSDNNSMTFVKYVAIDMLTAMSKIIGNNDSLDLTMCDRVQNCHSISNLYDTIMEYMETICDTIEHKYSKIKAKLTITDITIWAQEHFSDPNINISTAANHFKVSANYFSRTFKNGMGISFLDYINCLRVERTIDIMKNDGLPVEKAAIMAGFSNKRTFYRVRKTLKL